MGYIPIPMKMGYFCIRRRLFTLKQGFGAVILLSILCMIFYTSYFWANNKTDDIVKMVKTKPINVQKKLILLWTPFYGQNSISGWYGSNEDSFWNDCPYKCEFTMDKSLYNSSDALVVDGMDRNHALPPVHNLVNQIWIFHRVESAAQYRGKDWSSHENKFNWTMTYRRDSDVVWPAGRFSPIPVKRPKNIGTRYIDEQGTNKIPTLESLENKTGLIAWVVSNCHTAPSQRSKYVKILQKYIQVDIYGKCGKMTVMPGNSFKELAPEYKFWLAFENSICADYVTEKIFNSTREGVVPIVYGHPSFTEVTIPGSYINVYDFKTARDLAEYLMHLDANPNKYLKYFDWMKKYELPEDTDRRTWCNACTKLNTIDFNKDRKWYPNLKEWFHQNNTKKNLCYVPKFDNEGKFHHSV